MRLHSFTILLTLCTLVPCSTEFHSQDGFLSRSNHSGDQVRTFGEDLGNETEKRIDCLDYMTSEGCSWTTDWSCPGQDAGRRGKADDDGTVGYDCCCKQEKWKEKYECCDRELVDHVKSYWFTDFSIQIGNSEGPCCTIDNGFSHRKKVKLWSASKMVTGYVILRLIDIGLLSLETLAADVLDWWANDPSDKRSNVTVRHLLSQTDGFSKYHVLGMAIGLGLCTERDTLSCAKYAHDHLLVAAPGERFEYSETSFYVLGAIAMKVTGLSNFDSVFQDMIAVPLGMNCEFAGGALTTSSIQADPGAGLECSSDDYSKFLRVVYGRTLVSSHLHAEAERPQTVNASNMPTKAKRTVGGIQHYTLGSFRECANANCSDDDGVKIESMGAQGFYPWIWRNGRDSHWGILAQQGNIITAPSVSNGILEKAFPLARKAMEQMPTTTTTSTTTMTENDTMLPFLSNAWRKLAVRTDVLVLAVLGSVYLFVG